MNLLGDRQDTYGQEKAPSRSSRGSIIGGVLEADGAEPESGSPGHRCSRAPHQLDRDGQTLRLAHVQQAVPRALTVAGQDRQKGETADGEDGDPGGMVRRWSRLPTDMLCFA